MVRHILKILQQRVKRQPHEMVEHTQTIRQQFALWSRYKDVNQLIYIANWFADFFVIGRNHWP